MYGELLYVMPEEAKNAAGLKKVLADHPEILFVSMVGVDLRGNDTDERIPVSTFLGDVDQILAGGVQTDGSSVVLPGIATLNDAKVDLIADPGCNWIVDYNWEHIHLATGRPVGTLRIPSFLIHAGEAVDSRSVLARALKRLNDEIIAILKERKDGAMAFGFKGTDIVHIVATAGTELEFWVKTPGEKADIEELYTSQVLQESYWKRTKGAVRTALEESIMMLERYGLKPEMGHKEVGGIQSEVDPSGQFAHVMEQMEIDWSYAPALQAADNVILARNVIKETFRHHGLDVTFKAKPMEGVAGNGMHTHAGISARMKDGSIKNLFWPVDPLADFLNPIGLGAVMGLLKNYEVVGSMIASTNDAYNRLKPGFEAPVCICTSIGHSVGVPSRNRSVLAGLVRDLNNPLATRFEVRSPNPRSNEYLALAAIYQAMLDGIGYAVRSKRTAEDLLKELSKRPGDPAEYLDAARQYRSEEDVFEHFTQEQRDELFGKPPANVWEGLENLDKYPEKTAVLMAGGVFNEKTIHSFKIAMTNQWLLEIKDRIIPDNAGVVRACKKAHDSADGANGLDEDRWGKIQELRQYLAKDSEDRKCLFTRLREAAENRDYPKVSKLQLEMAARMKDLRSSYVTYVKNLL
ncbi:MAG: glutamine synthetase [Firmicutes bacterium]|nr:glutamine synthetase [Bacillota bacterium]